MCQDLHKYRKKVRAKARAKPKAKAGPGGGVKTPKKPKMVELKEWVDLKKFEADCPHGSRMWQDDYNNRFVMTYKGARAENANIPLATTSYY